MFPAWKAIVIGLAIGVSGILGDLAESLLKRSAGAKDAGHVVLMSENGIEALEKLEEDPGIALVVIALDQVTKDRPIPEKTYQLDLNETGTMILKVEPGDAAVYVDDSFFGNASQFSEYKGALVLRTGPHKVELSRPGFANYSTTVDITKDTVKEVHMTLKTLEVKP